MKPPILQIQDFKAHFHTRRGLVRAVDGVSFDVREGETVALVGESGSGKTVCQLSYLRLLPRPPLKIEGGSVHFEGKDILTCSDAEMRALRGNRISMIFQEPMTSLNPYLHVGTQITEPLRVHRKMSRAQALKEAQAALERVGISDAVKRLRQYPHEFSGGMRQRVMIAMALTTKPSLLIADEPTTALDVTVQAQILSLLKDIQKETKMAVLFITHDLGVVASIADRVVVMYAGQVVEKGPVDSIFHETKHAYTKGLLKATPRIDGAATASKTLTGSPVVARVDKLSVHYHVRGSWGGLVRREPLRAVSDVSLDLRQGEILGLVGESGCGKSSLGKAIIRLIEPTEGGLEIAGKDFRSLRANALREHRRTIQMVFQDPYASLDPRMTIGNTLAEPLRAHGTYSASQLKEKISKALGLVGLSESVAQRYPHEFSGGQRQRIAIARALILDPKVLIADEPVSSLDVSVQAQILDLLRSIQKQLDLSMVFVSHNLAVVRALADRVAVMYLGKIVEKGSREELFLSPKHPYTQALLAAVPIPDPRIERKRVYVALKGDIPSAANPPTGCAFHTRCPLAFDRCRKETPRLDPTQGTQSVACFAVNK